MEPILDETTLVPDVRSTPAERILRLAKLLRDLDERGAMPVLRSVRDAKDRDVGGRRGLQSWCFAFSEQVDRDAGRLVASRLGKQPFIDGADGLLARAEGRATIEARVGEQVAYGMAYAVLTDGIVVGLTCEGAVRALDRGAHEWPPDAPFSPWGSVRYSDESNATLDHKRLGKLRDFPAPDGFPAMRWRFHTKLAGGFRLYFHAQRADGEGSVVLVGYVGPHLKTVKFK